MRRPSAVDGTLLTPAFTFDQNSSIGFKKGEYGVYSLRWLGVICSLGVANFGLKVNKAGTKWKKSMAFLIHVMDVLDKHSLKGCNLVIDNAPIHKPEKTTEEANKRGFPMTDRDNLVASIREAAEKVAPEDCQGWIRHPESFFERCLNKEELL
ncbi:hypothetical protein G6F64_005168 [Rhizopus arrhizus]|uniref:Tc1-like transposase DDE domain-containing protein n=1 Tax=Rhizopus oryzae TaxID=64495 RepID=A0A9P6XB27_RHIOR|nr:hypothetical protein G6F23_004258 [Rhizopus arrhizus]KAG0762888.1 hypothetical protein G6F24_006452 [Rhizopus arrhizus]KAG0949234.1 hypothetical protein G6F32_005550 [Rhizopus arrhizus]KAG1309621.1 hypothetical protein G6F64_005168 [Rhizopus arrhizus]